MLQIGTVELDGNSIIYCNSINVINSVHVINNSEGELRALVWTGLKMLKIDSEHFLLVLLAFFSFILFVLV